MLGHVLLCLVCLLCVYDCLMCFGCISVGYVCLVLFDVALCVSVCLYLLRAMLFGDVRCVRDLSMVAYWVFEFLYGVDVFCCLMLFCVNVCCHYLFWVMRLLFGI